MELEIDIKLENMEVDELENLLVDPEDITNPANMDCIIIHLEKQRAADEEFMEILVERLKYAVINWERPWYQQYNTLTRPLSSKDAHDEDYLKDAISKAEGEKIVKNWTKFVKKYDVPNTPISFVRWKNKDKCKNPKAHEEQARQFVTAFLARGLQRTLKQVYHFCNSYFGCPNKRKYTLNEERIMKACFYHNPKKAVPYLTSVLGREPRGIYKRLKQPNNGNNGKAVRQNIKWDLSLATKFLTKLLEYSGLNVEDLKRRHIDKEIWIQLENDFDMKSYNLQRFWYYKLHVQLFVKKTVKIKKLQKNILKELTTFPYQVWSDIRWKEIENLFSDGLTKEFLYSTLHKVVRRIPKYHKINFQELAEKALDYIDDRSRNKRLKTLTFDGLKLKEINYSENI